MKKVLLSFSALLLIVIMSVSCNKNSPKDVATAWLTSFYHLDFEAAKKTSTDDTKTLLATLQQFTSMVADSSKKERQNISVNVKNVKEDGDKAIATYTTSDYPAKDQSLNLIKQNGKWLVQFSKNDQVGGAADSAGAEQPMGADSSGAGGSMPDSTMH
jgi:uncharacterized protein YxeA